VEGVGWVDQELALVQQVIASVPSAVKGSRMAEGFPVTA